MGAAVRALSPGLPSLPRRVPIPRGWSRPPSSQSESGARRPRSGAHERPEFFRAEDGCAQFIGLDSGRPAGGDPLPRPEGSARAPQRESRAQFFTEAPAARLEPALLEQTIGLASSRVGLMLVPCRHRARRCQALGTREVALGPARPAGPRSGRAHGSGRSSPPGHDAAVHDVGRQ